MTFISANGHCVQSASTVFLDLSFSRLSKKYISSSFELRAGHENALFPTFPNDQPIASKHKGLYFNAANSSRYLTLIPTTPLALAPSLTVMTWLRPQGSSRRTIITKSIGRCHVFALTINTEEAVEITVGSNAYADTENVVDDIWVHVAVNIVWNGSAQTSDVLFYRKGQET